MKKQFLILLFLVPVFALAQNGIPYDFLDPIEIDSLRSTGQPQGRFMQTDGNGGIVYVDAVGTDDQTASEVPIDDAGALITATEVEGALQENRTAINLNTAKTSFPGFTSLLSDYGFTDNSTNWDAAFLWGNHSVAGYLSDAPSDGQEYVRKNLTWQVATGGGGGITYSPAQTITYSATPTMDFSTNSNGVITLTGDVTTFTLTNVPDGGWGNIDVVQDATGGHGIAAISHTGLTIIYGPGKVPTSANIDSDPGKITSIGYRRDGSNLKVSFKAKYTTDDLEEGSNLYYTEARVSANLAVNANTAKVSFPEAPSDGNQYARKDGAWEQVTGGSNTVDTLYIIKEIGYDESAALTVGTAKETFRMPYGGTLHEARINVATAPVGSALIVDLNEDGTSILLTALSIDSGEKTSKTATTAAVISDSYLADDSEITVDIDQVGSTVAGAGLELILKMLPYTGQPSPVPTGPWANNTNIITGLASSVYAKPNCFMLNSVIYCLVGNQDGTLTGYAWNGSAWAASTYIETGLGDVGNYSSPATIVINSDLYLVQAGTNQPALGYMWNPTTEQWDNNSTITTGLTTSGDAAMTAFSIAGNHYIIRGDYFGGFEGFVWNGSGWDPDTGIVTGLTGIGNKSTPFVFEFNSNNYLITGRESGTFLGYAWNGSGWDPDTGIVTGLTGIGNNSTPTVIMIGNDLYLITGSSTGAFTGFKY